MTHFLTFTTFSMSSFGEKTKLWGRRTFQMLRNKLSTRPSLPPQSDLYCWAEQSVRYGLEAEFQKALETQELLESAVKEYMANGFCYGEHDDLYIFPEPSYSEETVVDEAEVPDNFSTVLMGFPPEALHDLMTSRQINILIIVFYTFVTTYCFGWMPFTLASTALGLVFCVLNRMMGWNF
jgi:hypothetical protein